MWAYHRTGTKEKGESGMIFFIASTKKQNLISQVIYECEEKIIDQVCAERFNLLRYVTSNISMIDSVDIMIVELTACENSEDDILQALESIRIMNDKIRIIVCDETRYEGDKLLAKCFATGIYDLIVTDDNVEFKEKLAYCITTGRKYKDSTEFQNYIPYGEYEAKRNQKPDAEDVEIGLAGTHARIGVTHSMIVLANHLRKKGYLVAMADMAKNPSFTYIESSFDCDVKKDYFTLDGIDYYRNPDLKNIKEKGYNFILIDFGEYLKRETESYALCDIHLIIAGAKPWEVEQTTNIFQDTLEEELKEYHYYFNFVSDDLKEEVKIGMGTLDSVHFLTYTEDPFNENEFPDIADIVKRYKEPTISGEKKKKKGFMKKG